MAPRPRVDWIDLRPTSMRRMGFERIFKVLRQIPCIDPLFWQQKVPAV